MRRLSTLLLATSALFLLAPNWLGEPPPPKGGGGDLAMLEYCSEGGKGIGYNSDIGLYTATCGNFNWSAQIGGVDGSGISDPNTPTTAGGNSWIMDCTGDGTATGTPDEQVVCLEDGEQIIMYAMADMMLAHDSTIPGGKIYLPAGIYHDKGCGQDADGNANNCPVLPNYPTHYQRRIQAFGGREFVGAGMDTDGLLNGRTGTWLLSDHGNDANTCAICVACGNNCDADPADGVTFGTGGTPHWAFRVGGIPNPNVCYRDQTDAGCVASTVQHQVSSNTWAQTSEITTNYSQLQTSFDLCIDDDIATTASCAENRQIICTDTVGGRLSATTGDCVFDAGDLGPCEGFATAVETDMGGEPELITTFTVQGPENFGNETTPLISGHWGAFESPKQMDAVCNVSDREIRYGTPPLPVSRYDVGTQSGVVRVTERGHFDNTGGGFRNINFMPANWIGRDSSNNDADCAASADDACDELDIFAFGGGIKGHAESITIWHAGGGDNFSTIDGSVMGFGTTLRDSIITNGQGLITDASGWSFYNNDFRNWDCGPSGCITLNFNPGVVFRDNRIHQLITSGGIIKVIGTGGVIDGLEINNSTATLGLLRLTSPLRNTTFRNFYGYGVLGNLVYLSPLDDDEVWNIHIEDFNFRGWAPQSPNAARPPAMIVVDDGNDAGNGNQDTMLFRNIHFEHIHASTGMDASREPCAVFLGGGTGDESDQDNGLDRNVDDLRNELHFKDIALEITYDGGGSATGFFCLGNAANGENEASETDPIWAARGAVPSWENIVVEGIRLADNPYPSQVAAEVDDCDDIIVGGAFGSTIVRIHDDTTADGTCAHVNGLLTGASTFSSLCVCGADGDWEPVTFE